MQPVLRDRASLSILRCSCLAVCLVEKCWKPALSSFACNMSIVQCSPDFLALRWPCQDIEQKLSQWPLRFRHYSLFRGSKACACHAVLVMLMNSLVYKNVDSTVHIACPFGHAQYNIVCAFRFRKHNRACHGAWMLCCMMKFAKGGKTCAIIILQGETCTTISGGEAGFFACGQPSSCLASALQPV